MNTAQIAKINQQNSLASRCLSETAPILDAIVENQLEAAKNEPSSTSLETL